MSISTVEGVQQQTTSPRAFLRGAPTTGSTRFDEGLSTSMMNSSIDELAALAEDPSVSLTENIFDEWSALAEELFVSVAKDPIDELMGPAEWSPPTETSIPGEALPTTPGQAAGFPSDDAKPKKAPRRTRGRATRPPPAPVACVNCRGRKVRCDTSITGIPCSNCSHFDEFCSVAPRKRRSDNW